MKPVDAPLAARARGLSLHLCSRDELERWAGLPGVPALAQALAASGRLAAPLPIGAGAADVEQAQRRTAASYLSTLARWAGQTHPLLDAFSAEQERRSLRALLRGAVEGVPAQARLAGLLPTPRLPAAVLEELAQARSAREVATRLLVLGDAHAPALVALTAAAHADLLEIELALARVLGERWQRAAARGDAALRKAIRLRIDQGNVQAALALAGGPAGNAAASLFMAGGQAVDRATFVSAGNAGSAAAAAAMLARALAGTALGKLLADGPVDGARLEAQALVATIAALRRDSRLTPLGSAPAQCFLARLEAQARDLRRLAWGLALGMPPAALREGLVTPWH